MRAARLCVVLMLSTSVLRGQAPSVPQGLCQEVTANIAKYVGKPVTFVGV
jgi:hypothetical protein